ncbi:MAG: cell wall hydrolase [Defluviitaleaceae bacterium]|nr:cell wall hydrolase [Defluviitaleaceae bacterium]
MRIVISSGHGLFVAGAVGIIEEVPHARLVADRVAEILREAGAEAQVFHENTARNARANLANIINHHNGQTRELDVSVHFNAVGGGIREEGIGAEVLYKHGNARTRALAEQTSRAIAAASGLRDRGAKPRKNLGFLNSTTRDALLIEVCFVNSRTDVELYRRGFEQICRAITQSLGGQTLDPAEPSESKDMSVPLDTKPHRSPETAVNHCGSGSDSASVKRNCRNVRILHDLGVINSPEYWRGVSLTWLDELLGNAAQPGRLDARVDNGIGDTGTALCVLEDAGIINSPGYWRGVLPAGNVPHLDELLRNIANRSRDVLERIVHAEARGEDARGQTLVANVVLNRHRGAGFPAGIRNVVFARGLNSQGRRVYQFSPVANGAYAAARPAEATRRAVSDALSGIDTSQGATFFIANHAAPGSWHEQALTRLFTHGGHTFYR